MELRLSFSTENDAFGKNLAPECARILRQTADKIMDGYDIGVIRDINGNTIGQWDLEAPDAPEQDDERRPMQFITHPDDMGKDHL